MKPLGNFKSYSIPSMTLGLMLAAFFILYGARLSFAQNLKNCDLIFHAQGHGEFSNAISESTGAQDSVKFVHVGIIEVDKERKPYVIEASPEEGVRTITLSEFLSQSPHQAGKPRVVIKRLSIPIDEEKIIIRAKSFMGQPYDWWYLPDNEKLYCSELVQICFIDSSGNNIFPTQPMNFRDKDGNIPSFWIDLFKELDMDVPEGIPGTNPNDLSKHPLLFEVFRYF